MALGLVACSDDTTPTNNAATNNTATNNTATNNTATNNTATNNTATNNAATNNTATNNTATNNAVTNNNPDVDMGEDMTPDMDVFVDPYPNRPLGQCVVDADCPENPNGKVCNQLLPGGSCGACDAFNDLYCDDTCFNGTCITTCQDTEDCPPGLSCSNGRCGATSCVDGTCPIPWFGCSASDRCQRISCEQNTNICPEGTECVSGLCMEKRML
jgi:hypothetical protein